MSAKADFGGIMSIDKVRAYLAGFGAEDRIREFDVSSATVELAAKALGTQECRIAKTLSFMLGDRVILVVAAGDVKVDNRKYKDFSAARRRCCRAKRRKPSRGTPWAACVLLR